MICNAKGIPNAIAQKTKTKLKVYHIYSLSKFHQMIWALLYRNFETSLKLVTAKNSATTFENRGDQIVEKIFPPDMSQLLEAYLLRIV